MFVSFTGSFLELSLDGFHLDKVQKFIYHYSHQLNKVKKACAVIPR
jgi:hypothetical protein